MKILFMGTPEFALFSLTALAESGRHTVVGVVTREDKPKGRGYELTPPPVKVYATEHRIPVFQPTTLKDEAFAKTLSDCNPDAIVVTAYGKILPENVLNYPKYGCINVHGSLLPEYRGAAPMQRAIMDGKKETGITTMYMEKGLDTGDMLLTATLPITDDDDFETIHDGLGKLSGELLLKTLDGIENGTLKGRKQDDSRSTYAEKIGKADCALDWNLPAVRLSAVVRGLSPFPLSFCTLPDGKTLKIVFAKAEETDCLEQPGTVLSLDGGVIRVATGKGVLAVTKVLPEGKKRMNASDFINGRKIAVGDVLGNGRID